MPALTDPERLAAYRRCRRCCQDRVVPTTIRYDAEVKLDGHVHNFVIASLKIPVCQACGEKVFTELVDDQMNSALRIHLGLLSPFEISAAMGRLNLTPADLADRLGIEDDTLLAWLTGTQIQSRAMDNLLRVYFSFPEVRTALTSRTRNGEHNSAAAS